jgi:hypothetical protein
MRKVITIASILFFVIVFMVSGCQATPQTQPVEPKNEGILENKIATGSIPSTVINAPKQWHETISPEKSHLKILIDAPVIIPDTDKYPVMRIRSAKFSQNMADRLINYFANGQPLYEADAPMTKAEIEQHIVMAKKDLEISLKGGTDISSPEEIRQHIKELETLYSTAPEKDSRKVIDTKLKVEPTTGREIFDAVININQLQRARLSLHNCSEKSLLSSFAYDTGSLYSPMANLYGKPAAGLKLTPEGAKQNAAQLLTELKINDMVIARVETGYKSDSYNPEKKDEQGYIVTFTRCVDNIPVVYSRVSSFERTDYAPRWSDMRIEIYLDDSGITSFRWLSYGEITDRLNDNVEMLPFEKIQEIFSQQIVRKFGSFDETVKAKGESVNQNVCVDRIELGLVSTPEKDRSGSYLLVPAWTFFGYTQITEDGQTRNTNDMRSIFTGHLVINAVDGTLIEN